MHEGLDGRLATPADIDAFTGFASVAAVARDETLAIFWCNADFAGLCGRSVEELIGTTPHDLVSRVAADERAALYREVILTGKGRHIIQMGADKRLLCTFLPLDERAFGHKGVFAMARSAALGESLHTLPSAQLLETPTLLEFKPLSIRELEVVYFVAAGWSTRQIADELCRSPKTIDHHVESIHRKLGTNLRSELVRKVAETGIQGFSRDEWERLLQGVARMRQEAPVDEDADRATTPGGSARS